MGQKKKKKRMEKNGPKKIKHRNNEMQKYKGKEKNGPKNNKWRKMDQKNKA